MIFAVNFPLCEQWFHKARGYPTIVAAVVLGGLSIWWYFEFYTKEKLEYNLTHSYSAIIPLTAYIFFRNITPQVRSGVSMSLHDLGKTTLETYLLQHHIWLTSNAKTLLTIVPDHPWINFALATVLFFTCAKELYRLTMSLRGMIMPEDKNIAWVNIMGMCSILGVLYLISVFLWAAKASLVHIALTCVGLFPVILLVIGRFAMVNRLIDVHCCIYHEEVKSVQRTDVVQNVRVSMGPHQEKHREVQPPHHLHHSKPTKVPLDEEKREVSKTCHPYVACDHHADTVVDLLGMEVVIQQKDKLHPPFPLLSLLPT
jgi:hypothetical protein